MRKRRIDCAIDGIFRRRGLFAQRDQFAADLFGELVAVRLGVIGQHEDARAAFRRVAIVEAMRDRDRQHAVLALERHDLVDEAAHRLDRGRKALDHAAIEYGFHRLDLAADGAQREIDHLLAALGEIRVRIFLEQHDHVGGGAALHGEMAVRVEFDADHGLRADQRAHAFEEIALAVVIAVRHHRAVQVEHRAVDRQRGFQLPEDLVAHPLVGFARGSAAWLRRVAGALDQFEAVTLRRGARGRDRAGLVAGFCRMLAGRVIELVEEGLIRGRNGKERVRLEGERGVEQAHSDELHVIPAPREAGSAASPRSITAGAFLTRPASIDRCSSRLAALATRAPG